MPTRFLSLRLALLAAIAFTALLSSAPAAEAPQRTILSAGTHQPTPTLAPASADAQNAIARMKLPAGLEAKLWAAEPMLGNPVAFNMDEKGRVFVTETYRYRVGGALDIRDYLWMLEEDLALRTVEQRTAMLAKNFGPEGMKALSVVGEIVRLVEDTDGDGVADRTSVYADGFNTPLDGIASGILARRGEVWFTNIPSIWKFTGERRAETRTEISRGYGVRFSFTGHDLHGPTFGPDGKIYFSFGDRGASVKTKEANTLNTPDYGAVYRMNPDGTQMELVADGMRNPQSLLFTENGDLVTGDNDSDMGDEERLVHVVEGGDSGWRIGYQHSPLAAVERIGPWSAEKMWSPRHAAQPAFMLPPICNIEDGPSGLAYYPGTGLNASYFGSIFITHFKGGSARSGIYTYNVKPEGASYQIADSKPFLTASLPTDVRFGPDGRVYISDWVEGYPQTMKGRIYTISDPQHVNDPLVKETQQLIGGNWTTRASDELAKLLGHADWRVRLEAQFTLAERGDASIPVLTRVATASAPAALAVGNAANLPAYARRHAIWGLGQIAQKTALSLAQHTTTIRPAAELAAKPVPALAALHTLVRDADPEVRAQSIKLLGDHRQTDEIDTVLAALKDANARVQFFAAQSLGKLAAAQPALAARIATALIAALRANNDADAVLRHACVMGLVGANHVATLSSASTDSSRAVRLGSLLAHRRLGRADIAKFLADADPFLAREAALAINDAPIAAALPALAALLDQGATDEAILYRTLNANFRLGGSANAVSLANYAARADAPEKFRYEALTQLALWANPPQRDRIVGLYRPLTTQTRLATAARDALAAVVPAVLDASAPASVQGAAIAALEKLQVPSAADSLFAVVSDEKQSEYNRSTALTALGNLRDPRLAAAVKIASAATTPRLRLAALPLAARLSPEAAAPALANFAASADPAEQKAAFETLGALKHASADAIFAEQLTLLAAGKISPAVQLELLEGAAKRDSSVVKKLLAERTVALSAGTDPLAAFGFVLQGGDRARGQTLFETQPVLACVRCHRIGTGPGGDAGPNLVDFGTKNTREHILESILKPNAKIATGFETIVLTRKSGGMAAGIVAAETADAISLRDVEGKGVAVKKSDIAKRDSAPSSMPEIYATLLTPSELRDVVEYVATLGAPMGRGGRGGRGGAGAGGPPVPGAAARGQGGFRGGAGFGAGGNAGELPPPRALRGLTAPSAPAPKTP